MKISMLDSAKDLSLSSKIFAIIWGLVWFIIYNIKVFNISDPQLINAYYDYTWNIIQQGIYFALLFTPVDISFWIQNIRGDRVKKEVLEKDIKNDYYTQEPHN